MKKALILMSTYNGMSVIERQVKSIINQENVEINVLIRDDGSSDATKDILNNIEKKYNEKVKIIYGTNVGWRKSFLSLLKIATLKYDYYGFSDQDDIWFKDKVSSCIDRMEEDSVTGIKMCHCNSIVVDENLIPQREQEIRKKEPVSHKNAFAMEYFQGCGMLWNYKCMEAVQSSTISNINISHDFWVGLISYLFGKVYFVEKPLFYHIRYGNNASSDGSVYKGRILRLKKVISSKNAYMNVADDLLSNFKDDLNSEDYDFLVKLKNYRNNIKAKKDILLDNNFSRNSKSATLLMKIAILFNKF